MAPTKANSSRARSRPAPPLPAISDAEWIVMREFWRRGRGTAADLVQALEGRMHWKPRTVQSLINRLVRKGALSFTKIGREHLYEPRVPESECVLEASRSFVDRIFGGRLAPLLACFVENGEVTPQEAEQLRQILEKGERHDR